MTFSYRETLRFARCRRSERSLRRMSATVQCRTTTLSTATNSPTPPGTQPHGIQLVAATEGLSRFVICRGTISSGWRENHPPNQGEGVDLSGQAELYEM